MADAGAGSDSYAQDLEVLGNDLLKWTREARGRELAMKAATIGGAPGPGEVGNLLANDPEYPQYTATITEAINRWTGLGNPADIEDVAESINDAATPLNCGGNGGDSGGVSGVIGTIIDSTKLAAQGLSGGSVTLFREKYLNRMSVPVDNLYVALKVAQAAAAAEAGIFRGVRENVLDAVTKARDAMKGVADPANTTGLSLVLKILETALEVAAGPLSGLTLATKALSATELIVTTLEPGQTKSESSLVNVKQVVDAFVATLDAIDQEFIECEQGLKQGLNESYDELVDERDYFALDYSPINSVDSCEGQIEMEQDAVHTICDINLPDIDAELRKAVLTVSEVDLRSVITRNPPVGMSVAGVSSAFEEYLNQVYVLLRNLREDLVEGRENLQAAYDALQNTDDEAAQSLLQTTVDNIERDDVNPWE